MPKSRSKRKRIVVVTGTRAEYGLLKPLIMELRQRKRISVDLLVTGMHTLGTFGQTINIIRRDRLPIAAVVPVAESDDMIQSLTKEILGIRKFLTQNTADAVVVLGDRDEPFAAAIVALHMNIPVIHISGGDVTGPAVDQYLRNAITVFAKLHLTTTAQSRQSVIRLGARPSQATVIGSLGLDGLTRQSLLSRAAVARILRLDIRKPWLFFLHHPTPFDHTPIPKQITPLVEVIRGLTGERVIVYPNADTGSATFIRSIQSLAKEKNIHIVPNLPRPLFLGLLGQSVAFIGNSSAGLVETGHLRVPFVNIGNRQKNRERGSNVIEATYASGSIRSAITKALSPAFRRQMLGTSPYRGGSVAKRAVNAIEHFLQTSIREEP